MSARNTISQEDLEFEKALQKLDFEPQPLKVYTSNSTIRVGLKSRYQEVVVWGIPSSPDGIGTIVGRRTLEAMVTAFNAMLVRRNALRAQSAGICNSEYEGFVCVLPYGHPGNHKANKQSTGARNKSNLYFDFAEWLNA